MPIRIGDKEVRTRKERRKEARQGKLQQRLHAWALHQAGKRRRAEHAVVPEQVVSGNLAKEEKQFKSERSTSVASSDAAIENKNGRRIGRQMAERKAKRGRTNFEEFLEKDIKKVSAEEDLALERQLAKKLKVKKGKLGGFADGMADILDGLDEEAGMMEMEQRKGKQVTGVLKDVGKKKKSLKNKSEFPAEGMDGTNTGNSEIYVQDVDESSGDSMDDSEEEEDGIANSDLEDQEEFGLALGEESGASESALDSDRVDVSDEDAQALGSDEEREEDDEDKEGYEPDDKVGNKRLSKESRITKDSGKGASGDRGEEEGRAAVKYVPPHLREKASSDSEEMARIQRRVRGLLNRLSEANVESISFDVSNLFQAHGRRMVTEIVTNEIIGACCGGPRGNDQYAAVFAAYVAGTAAMVGMDFGAKFLASLARAFEEQYVKEDSLAIRNLTLLFANLYSFSLLPSELVYEVLSMLCTRFEELDVATILTLLQSCGMGLRAADPASMKEFVVSVQQRTAELKASLARKNDGSPVDLGKRVQFMLDMICDIKNNKRRPKDDPAHHTRLKKWLQKEAPGDPSLPWSLTPIPYSAPVPKIVSRRTVDQHAPMFLQLGVEDVQLRSVTWVKLLDPEKKGQWWMPGVPGEVGENMAIARAEVAGVMDAGAAEADKMLQLAASQRMNTDARRALFCVVMSAEDNVDAFEKILRLKLPGKQDREVVRVIVDCCLQELHFNEYYALVLKKLCHHEKNHKFSFQYCLWDHLKQLDKMDMRRSRNLACLTAFLVGSFSLSLSIVKVQDFIDIQNLTPKVIMYFRIMFDYLLSKHTDDEIWNVFSRIAIGSELAALRDGLALFLHQHILKEVKKGDSTRGALLAKRCKLAKKALANVEGLPFGSQSRDT